MGEKILSRVWNLFRLRYLSSRDIMKMKYVYPKICVFPRRPGSSILVGEKMGAEEAAAVYEEVVVEILTCVTTRSLLFSLERERRDMTRVTSGEGRTKSESEVRRFERSEAIFRGVMVVITKSHVLS